MKIIAAILLALSFSVSAEPTYLYTEVSQPGETMDAFVVRIARAAEIQGKKANAEVCGAISEVNGLYKVSMQTKGNNIQCTVRHADSDYLIHTHLDYMGSRFSPADYSHKGYMVRNGVVCFNDGKVGSEAIVTKSGRKGGSKCMASQY